MNDEKRQEVREQSAFRPCKNSISVELSREASSALGDAYELLCLAFRLPNAVLFDGMKDGRLLDSVRSIADDLGLDNGGECIPFVMERLEEARCLQGDALGSLRVAYTNLFTHPVAPRVMCHESLFLYFEADPGAPIGNAPRLFINNAALSVERIMRESGLHRSEERNESSDHIATELELLGRLFTHRAECLVESGAEEVLAVDSVIGEIVHYHCKKWHPSFFKAVMNAGEHPFYTGLAAWGLRVTELVMESYGKQ